MSLHPTTFTYVRTSDLGRADVMHYLSEQAAKYAAVLEQALDDGPDKDYVLRHLRETSMWATVALFREADGTPRP
jgi:hypothetical protein